jgi:hypothetical protein
MTVGWRKLSYNDRNDSQDIVAQWAPGRMLSVARSSPNSGFIEANYCWIKHSKLVKNYVVSHQDWVMIQPTGQASRMLSTPERLSGVLNL